MKFPDFNELPPLTPEMKELHDIQQKTCAEISFKLAGALDSAIRGFVNEIEQRDVPTHEIIQGATRVHLATAANTDLGDWADFFIWRGHVLAYRTLGGSHANDTTQIATLEYVLQTLPLARDQWPKALVNFIEGESHE